MARSALLAVGWADAGDPGLGGSGRRGGDGVGVPVFETEDGPSVAPGVPDAVTIGAVLLRCARAGRRPGPSARVHGQGGPDHDRRGRAEHPGVVGSRGACGRVRRGAARRPCGRNGARREQWEHRVPRAMPVRPCCGAPRPRWSAPAGERGGRAGAAGVADAAPRPARRAARRPGGGRRGRAGGVPVRLAQERPRGKAGRTLRGGRCRARRGRSRRGNEAAP